MSVKCAWSPRCCCPSTAVTFWICHSPGQTRCLTGTRDRQLMFSLINSRHTYLSALTPQYSTAAPAPLSKSVLKNDTSDQLAARVNCPAFLNNLLRAGRSHSLAALFGCSNKVHRWFQVANEFQHEMQMCKKARSTNLMDQ